MKTTFIPAEVYIKLVNYFIDRMMNKDVDSAVKYDYKCAAYWLMQVYEYQNSGDVVYLGKCIENLYRFKAAEDHILFVYQQECSKDTYTPEMDWFVSMAPSRKQIVTRDLSGNNMN